MKISSLKMVVIVLLTFSLISMLSVFWELTGTTLKAIQVVLFICDFIILTGLWLMNHKKIIAPLQKLTEAAEEISKGNLKMEIIAGADGDEINTLANAMNRMVVAFGSIINSVMMSSNNVISAVDVLRTRAEKTASGAKEQSLQAHQIATAAEEMSQTITDIAKNASTASESSSEAMDIAEGGKQVTDITVDIINEVNSAAGELAAIIERLNRSVSEIGDIVTVIKDIADQTNLLALNAAIEAARAGDQGRGFGVVADEVRKLAEKTIKATSEISEKINNVQTESGHTAASMTAASKGFSKASSNVKNLNNVLNTIVESIQRVRDQIVHIATAVEEQSSASEEVARNIEKTSNISMDTEKMSEDVMHEVNSLTRIVEDLRNSTSGFSTKGSELMILDIAKTDHRVFIGKIASCLKGDLVLSASDITDHFSCRFGKWYFGIGKDICGQLHSYKAIDTPHKKIHELAKEAVAAVNSRDMGKAQMAYNQMEEVSDQIGSLLDGIRRECKLSDGKNG